MAWLLGLLSPLPGGIGIREGFLVQEIAKAILRLKTYSVLREALIRQGYDRAESSFRYQFLTQKFDLYMCRLCGAALVKSTTINSLLRLFRRLEKEG